MRLRKLNRVTNHPFHRTKNDNFDIYYWIIPHKTILWRTKMASKEGMFFKFFEKWKKKRLNKFAKDMLKDNPELEKSMKKMDDALDDALKMIKRGEAPY